MEDETFVQSLKDKAKDLQNRLKHIEGLIEIYDNDVDHKEPQTQEEFTPEIPRKDDEPKTLTDRAKEGIKNLISYSFSYKKSDLEYNLEKLGIEVTSATLNRALKTLRENKEVIGYRINRSNQNVFYMSVEGVDDTNNRYPVQEEYRTEEFSSDEITEFEFLD